MIVKLSEEYGQFNLNILDESNPKEVWIAECDRCLYMPEIAFSEIELTQDWVEETYEFHFIGEETICNDCMMKYSGVN